MHAREIYHFLYRKLIQPKSGDEDSKRREFILNVLLLGSVTFSLVAVAIVAVDILLLGTAYRGVSFQIILIPFAIFLALYLLARSKFHRAAAHLLILIYLSLATYTVYNWGLLLAQGVLVYVLVIIMAAILIGTTYAVLMNLVAAAAFLIFAYFFTHNLVQPNLYWVREGGDWGDAIAYIVTFGVITLVSWLSNREIERSLVRARRSEADLEKERDLLEVKVEERTKELKYTQMERMHQLYRFAAFGKLASGLFHDLVNPLTTVTLNLERLGATQRSLLVKRAIEGTKRMEGFIEAARKQIQQQTQLARFSLREEIKQAIEVLRFRAEEERVTIQFHQQGDIQIFGDPVKFHQLITNLLSNAIDAYQGVRRTGKERRVRIGLQESNERALLTIQDWGKGIPVRHRQAIFEPFFTTKKIGQGTGIGLSIVKEIVEKDFKGTIAVTSTEGQGTTFTVEFPLRR